MLEQRNCVACGNSLKGRIDKKFCDDYCRNNFHYQHKTRNNYNPLIKAINSALQKNRKILETIFEENKSSPYVSRERLQFLGFQFVFHTHTRMSEEGKVQHFCYDYGYLKEENDCVLILRSNEKWIFG